MPDTTAPPPARDAWPAMLSAKVLADYLSVSKRTVWKLAATGALPAPVKLPGSTLKRWDRVAVDEARESWRQR